VGQGFSGLLESSQKIGRHLAQFFSMMSYLLIPAPRMGLGAREGNIIN